MSVPDANPVDKLAAEFVDRSRRGERPTVDDYAERYPDLADQIRELFPTIAALEQLRAQKSRSNGARASLGGAKLTRLGDFRIVRELGRGGMGVVYEAVQESLSRRVAVKVLARHARLDDSYRPRFIREARTAGRLHHTNIVPILGVGEQDGFDFYVMQYIDGVGLDAVIARMKESAGEDFAALRLSSFWRDSTLQHKAATNRDWGSAAQDHATQPISADLTSRPVVPALEPTGSDQPSIHPVSKAVRNDSVFHSGHSFWQDVAQVGYQAAQALEYAHAQGTLHRDIKPGNLLLDGQGTIWIADFGLAKVEEQDGLSRTGDVLGTVYYMAPEQWRGEADARSDVFSLGVTLFELLALRLPWSRRERARGTTASTPEPTVSLRQCAPGIPRDLETIVLKAIAEESAQRYATADELAADLERFLTDQPISARPPKLAERCVRWCRRNPAIAGLSVLAVALLVLVAASSLIGYMRTNAALARESDQRQRAEQTLAISLEALERVYGRLVPDRFGEGQPFAVTADETSGVATAQPNVSPETAALLEELLPLYDRLAAHGGSQERLRVEGARASRRIGDINLRLGNFAKAESAYRAALAKYEELPSEPNRQLDLARLRNQLGTIFSHTGERDKSLAEFRSAQSLLLAESLTADTLDHWFELALTHYHLGRAPAPGLILFMGGESALAGLGPGRRGGPPDGPFGPRDIGPPGEGQFDQFHPPPGGPGFPPPGGRPGMGAPPDARVNDSASGREEFEKTNSTNPDALSAPPQSDAAELNQAVDILKPLVRSHPEHPEYVRLLAVCYRELAVAEVLPDITESETLLKQLVEGFPGVADYRYELAETYGMLDVRRLKATDLTEAERRLRAALEQCTRLVESNPFAPDYAVQYVHTLNKLARVLREKVAGESGPAGRQERMSRFDEMTDLYTQALRRLEALVEKYPRAVTHSFWLAKVRKSLAEVWFARGRLSDAQLLLDKAIAQLESISTSGPDTDAVQDLLVDLRRTRSTPPQRPDDPGRDGPHGDPRRPPFGGPGGPRDGPGGGPGGPGGPGGGPPH